MRSDGNDVGDTHAVFIGHDHPPTLSNQIPGDQDVSGSPATQAVEIATEPTCVRRNSSFNVMVMRVRLRSTVSLTGYP